MKSFRNIYFLFLILPLLLNSCLFDSAEFEEAIDGQQVLFITRENDSQVIPADGLTRARLKIVMTESEKKNRKVKLTTDNGTFPNGEKTIEIELERIKNSIESEGFVDLIASTNRGSVMVIATVGEIKDVLELEFSEVGFSIEQITDISQAPIMADGVSEVTLNISIDPDLQEGDFAKRTINLSTINASFLDGKETFDLVFKGESTKIVKLKTTTTAGEALLKGKYFDFESSFTSTVSKAFPTGLILSGENVIMYDTVGTEFMLSAQLTRPSGVPTKGHAVNFILPTLDAQGQPIDAVFKNITKSDANGIATATFVVLSQINPGDLTFKASFVDESGSVIMASATVRVTD